MASTFLSLEHRQQQQQQGSLEEEFSRIQAELAECEAQLACERSERQRLLSGVAPFADAYDKYVRQVLEYQQMEPALRGRIATLESILDGDDEHMLGELLECEQCEAPLNAKNQQQCLTCIGDETVCIGCCRYPTVHGCQ